MTNTLFSRFMSAGTEALSALYSARLAQISKLTYLRVVVFSSVALIGETVNQ